MSVLKRKNELGQWEPIQQVTSNALTLGGKPPEQYLQPLNLLDNSDFTNPVNQRGQTSYTGSVYSIDRWRAFHADTTHTVVDGGVSVSSTAANPNIYQPLDASRMKEGQIYTAAACDTDGNIYIWTGTKDNTSGAAPVCVYVSDERLLFRLTGKNNTWVWAALYEGEYTAETLPPYVPKGYGAELAECQRYYENSWFPYSKTVQYQFFGFSAISTGLDAYFNFKTIKRIIPTITLYPAGGASGWKYYTGSWNESETLPAIYTRCAASGFMTRLSVSGVTTKAVYCQEGHWEASADL